MSYDEKYRKRTVEYLEEGHSYRVTAETFGISTRTLGNWVEKYKATGSLASSPAKSRLRKIAPDKLKLYIQEHPDAYQLEIAGEFGCTQQAIHKALKRLGITRKKRPNATKNNAWNK